MKTIAAVRSAMMSKIANSLLGEADAKKLKFRPMTEIESKTLKLPVAGAGFVIPYFDINGKETHFWRYRYLAETRKGFALLSGQKPLRYVQPPNTVNEPYLSPVLNWVDIAGDAEQSIVITEGELKAAAACSKDITTIGLGGVYSFKSSKNGVAMLNTLRKFDWSGRCVTICYDSDAISNVNVIIAENQLAKLLMEEGAKVHICRLPPGPNGEKIGMDDYLLTHVPQELKDLLNAAAPYIGSECLHEMSEKVIYVRDPGFVYEYHTGMKISPHDFVNHSYSNFSYDLQIPLTNGGNRTQTIQTAAAWLKWKSRPELTKVTFEPGQALVTDSGALNQWKGWTIEPKRGAVKPWHDLLDWLFTGAEKEARKWFEQWCAYPLQNPGSKMASAVLFWGVAQGSGKTLVGHTLMRIYGAYSTEIKDSDLDSPRFEWAENKQFVLADDITGQDNRKLKRRLMTMITQQLIRLDPKFIRSYTIRDCINYYFTSNDPDALYMDDTDRRNFIHEVIVGMLPESQRKEYVKWRDSDAGIAALFYYLLNLDLTGFDPQSPPFRTAAKNEMTVLTKSDVASWVNELKFNADHKLKLPGDLFTASELLAMYDATGAGRVTANGLARELKRSGFASPGKAPSMAITAFGNVRLYAIRNIEHWQTAPMKEIINHYEKSRVNTIRTTKF